VDGAGGEPPTSAPFVSLGGISGAILRSATATNPGKVRGEVAREERSVIGRIPAAARRFPGSLSEAGVAYCSPVAASRGEVLSLVRDRRSIALSVGATASSQARGRREFVQRRGRCSGYVIAPRAAEPAGSVARVCAASWTSRSSPAGTLTLACQVASSAPGCPQRTSQVRRIGHPKQQRHTRKECASACALKHHLRPKRVPTGDGFPRFPLVLVAGDVGVVLA